ncbi:MAG: polysaccharide ABC transporter ATP-binding protein [Candidatus Saccharibacteria bacterium]|nr:polysaccharide ABC transporter ATP-binding protein [Candidatus Saccharibacteria bacterium]
MQDDVAIKVHDLHKSFDFAENKHTSIKQLIVNIGKKNHKHRQKVLDGIDFEIKKGEFFGIVGRNGSGKSTLLKLLAGVYTPDAGAIQVNGQLTPFIELGVGFNPELTGKDNVYLSAALLGFTRKQVDALYDDIVDFSELHEHMDKKLKNYSSGMQVRLAFSIAVKAKNDILIFDEVLAVGDEAFQKKCMKIFEQYRRNKQTVILVTHSMDSVRRLCTRALMLSDGKIELIGTVKKVAEAYSKSNADAAGPQQVVHQIKNPKGLQLTGHEANYNPGDVMNLRIEWPGIKNVSKIGVAIVGSKGEYIFGSNTGDIVVTGERIDYSVHLDLGPDNYYLTVALSDKNGDNIALYEKNWKFLVYDDLRNDVGGQTRLSYEYSHFTSIDEVKKV